MAVYTAVLAVLAGAIAVRVLGRLLHKGLTPWVLVVAYLVLGVFGACFWVLAN